MAYIELIRPDALVAAAVFILGCMALGAFAIYVDNKRENGTRRMMHKRFKALKKRSNL